jgi:hypothetical protein
MGAHREGRLYNEGACCKAGPVPGGGPLPGGGGVPIALATAPPLEAAKPKRLANLSAANRKSREEAEARLAEALRRLQARGSGLACAPKEAKVGHRKAAEWLRRMRS